MVPLAGGVSLEEVCLQGYSLALVPTFCHLLSPVLLRLSANICNKAPSPQRATCCHFSILVDCATSTTSQNEALFSDLLPMFVHSTEKTADVKKPWGEAELLANHVVLGPSNWLVEGMWKSLKLRGGEIPEWLEQRLTCRSLEDQNVK